MEPRWKLFAKSIVAPIAAGKESPREDLSFGARPTPLNTFAALRRFYFELDVVGQGGRESLRGLREH
jgi:hypothetical protein